MSIHLIPTDDILTTEVAPSVAGSPKLSPLGGFIKAFNDIDGEAVAKRLPTIITSVSATAFVTWLIWEQSVGLYSSSGFANSGLAALGAIALVVGSAAIHATQRSWKSLLLCLFVMAYEAAFMVSGTMQDESLAKVAALESLPAFIHANAEVERTSADYERYNSRYTDPTDKMFENAWFRKNHVDPSWDKFSAAQASFTRVESAYPVSFDHVGWLKVMYRLGLVFLFMLLVHRLAGSGIVWTPDSGI